MDPCNLMEDMLQFMQQLSVMVGQQVTTAIATKRQPGMTGNAQVDPTKWGIADPGQFNASISKFEEWWSKMRAFMALAGFKTYWEDVLVRWPTFNKVQEEVERQLANIHQGNTRTEEFLAKFNALRTTSGVSNDYAIWMPERAMCPEILQQIYIQGRRKTMWKDFEPEVQNMGAALEAVGLQTSSSSGSC
ncbi:hypothetical protein EDC04DRAFT_2901427 [Pisolithus marmoratus]|nr:hypothetical protein EDC04DRAFT_2901427 [Pisolithus marmoratus]